MVMCLLFLKYSYFLEKHQLLRKYSVLRVMLILRCYMKLLDPLALAVLRVKNFKLYPRLKLLKYLSNFFIEFFNKVRLFLIWKFASQTCQNFAIQPWVGVIVFPHRLNFCVYWIFQVSTICCFPFESWHFSRSQCILSRHKNLHWTQ